MLNTLSVNKRRLYIAYYTRPTTSFDPHRYHSGLLALPKDRKTDATVFHATISPSSPWRFEAKNITPRTTRLVCLLFIGKLELTITDDVLVELLEKLPLNNVDPEWTCLDWMLAALTVRSRTLMASKEDLDFFLGGD
ncbi:hypothetical protein AX15_001707 [Amanita polypyramis BW_CC]|nr:hypothetical protein AX15_001707 [Amanita polypyramis BW_CC]